MLIVFSVATALTKFRRDKSNQIEEAISCEINKSHKDCCKTPHYPPCGWDKTNNKCIPKTDNIHCAENDFIIDNKNGTCSDGHLKTETSCCEALLYPPCAWNKLDNKCELSSNSLKCPSEYIEKILLEEEEKQKEEKDAEEKEENEDIPYKKGESEAKQLNVGKEIKVTKEPTKVLK